MLALAERNWEDVTSRPSNFIEPCMPKSAKALPTGAGRLFEPKMYGWHIQVVKSGQGCEAAHSNAPYCTARPTALSGGGCADPRRRTESIERQLGAQVVSPFIERAVQGPEISIRSS